MNEEQNHTPSPNGGHSEYRGGGVTHKRARSSRAKLNDSVILDAVLACTLKNGWDRVTFSAVAAQANLTVRPLNDRFKSKTDMAIALWGYGVREELVKTLEALFNAALYDDLSFFDRIRNFNTALALMQNPSPELEVAAELLLASLFDEKLRSYIQKEFESELGEMCILSDKSDEVSVIKHNVILVIAIGTLLNHKRGSVGFLDYTSPIYSLMHGLEHPGPNVKIPEISADYMANRPRISSSEPELNALLNALLDQITLTGYHGATTADIVERAGISEGFLYSRYKTKLDAFLHAIEMTYPISLRNDIDFQGKLSSQFGHALSEATMYREFMRPESWPTRVEALERVRISWREPRMLATMLECQQNVLGHYVESLPEHRRGEDQAELAWALSLGYGSMTLPLFYPDAWKLPFIILTAPIAACDRDPVVVAKQMQESGQAN